MGESGADPYRGGIQNSMSIKTDELTVRSVSVVSYLAIVLKSWSYSNSSTRARIPSFSNERSKVALVA
jgi:hypothetical protein